MAIAARPASILPPRLDALLAALTDVSRQPVIVRGWSRECEDDRHELARWLSGLYRPPVSPEMARRFPGVVPNPIALVLYLCLNCETVEVRDRSLDVIRDDSRVVAKGRRDGLLGWYSGARRSQRIYL